MRLTLTVSGLYSSIVFRVEMLLTVICSYVSKQEKIKKIWP